MSAFGRSKVPAAPTEGMVPGGRRDARLLAGMVIFVLVVAMAFGVLVYLVIQRIRINGPLYGEIIRQKELVADILPPTDYAIEAYMISLQLASPSRAEDRDTLIAKFRTMRERYEIKQWYWAEQLPPGPASDLLLSRSTVPARRMFDLIEDQLIPMAQGGDYATAELLVDRGILEEYLTHRAAIEDLVSIARRSAASVEEAAAEELTSVYLPLAVVMGVLLTSGGLFVLIRTLRLARDRAGRLAEVRTAELRQITDRFERAVAGTSDGLWDWDLATDEVYFAPRFKALLGFEADSPEFPNVLESFLRRLHPDDVTATRAAMERSISSGQPYRASFRLRAAGGEWRWFESRAAVVSDPAGKPVRMAGAITDITESRLVSEKQATLAAMLTNMGRMAQVGWWQVNLESGELIWSDVVYDIHDLPRGTPITTAEAVGFYADEVREQVAESFECGMLEGKSWDLELPLVTASGRRIWVRVIGEPVHEGARIVRLVGAFQDITERKEAEARTVESERRFRTIIEGTDVVVWELDTSINRFTYVSPQAERFGYPIERWYEEGFWVDHIHPADREQAVAYGNAESALGRNHRFRYRFIAADGRVLWFEDFVCVERQAQAGAGAILRGVLIDITAHEEAAETLRKTTETLNESQVVARMGSWSFDVATTMVSWSDQMFALFGHKDTNVAPDYDTVLAHFQPQDAGRLHAAVQRSLADGRPYSLTLRTSEPDPAVARCTCEPRGAPGAMTPDASSSSTAP